MMDHRKKKRHGRFGTVQRLASAAVIAVVAVSPAIVPMTGSLDGIERAVVEAVFGEPVYAQETPCGDLLACLRKAKSDYKHCLRDNPWYRDPACWAAHQLDKLSCGVDLLIC